MPTNDLRIDHKIAMDLVGKAPRMKPAGIVRAYRMEQDFTLDGSTGYAGDYMVLTPEGKLEIRPFDFVNKFFEPVAKRTRQPKETE